MYLFLFIGIELVQLDPENTRCIIHGAPDEPGKSKNGLMLRRASFAPGIEFISPCSFTGQEVGVSTMQACWSYGFMRIHHYFITSRLFHHSFIMFYHPLPVVVLTAG